MIEKIKMYLFAHLLGLAFILLGWYIAVFNIALDRFSSKAIFTTGTLMGLLFILIGAYLPHVLIAIKRRKIKTQ